jgi:hypothetical protein
MKWPVLVLLLASLALAQPCTEDILDTCPNGQQVIIYECVNGTHELRENQCEIECTTDLTEECKDGTFITIKFCVDGFYRAAAERSCPEPGKPVEECLDHDCKPPNDEPDFTTILFVVLFVFLFAILLHRFFKKRKEELDPPEPPPEIPLPPTPPSVDEECNEEGSECVTKK